MITIADVGDIPGKDPLTDAEKQAIADEWNANAAPAPVAAIPLSVDDILGLIEQRVGITDADKLALRQAKRDAGLA